MIKKMLDNDPESAKKSKLTSKFNHFCLWPRPARIQHFVIIRL